MKEIADFPSSTHCTIFCVVSQILRKTQINHHFCISEPRTTVDRFENKYISFKGICRKVLIFLLVGIANILDVQVIGTGSVLRTAVIFFYISNEGVSLVENAAHLGLPVPDKLKDVLEQLHDRDGKEGQ